MMRIVALFRVWSSVVTCFKTAAGSSLSADLTRILRCFSMTRLPIDLTWHVLSWCKQMLQFGSIHKKEKGPHWLGAEVLSENFSDEFSAIYVAMQS